MVIEAIGVIRGIKVSILFDFEATHYFLPLFVVECCRLVASRKNDNWEFELAFGAKVVINYIIHDYQIQIGNFNMTLDL